jgi:AraC family transcriptional regulator
MDWVDRLNNAIGYIEENLDGEIDPDEVSKILLTPYSVFQRLFGPIAGIQLSEYVRRRRLSMAVRDLKETDMRVIDVAVKYGYDSADAFSAAFRRVHGVSPQEARRPDVRLTFYPRMVFSLTITGGTEMDYRVIEKDAFTVVGVRRTTPEAGGTWAIVKSDGSLQKLDEMSGNACGLGLCFGFDAEGNNDYMVAAETGAPAPVLDGYEYPASTFLVFTAKGAVSEGVLGTTWQRIYGEFLPQSAYRQADLPTIERYVLWDEAADRCEVEIWIPVEP